MLGVFSKRRRVNNLVFPFFFFLVRFVHFGLEDTDKSCGERDKPYLLYGHLYR